MNLHLPGPHWAPLGPRRRARQLHGPCHTHFNPVDQSVDTHTHTHTYTLCEKLPTQTPWMPQGTALNSFKFSSGHKTWSAKTDHEARRLSVCLGSAVTSVPHESRWQSINAKVASLVFCLLASVEGTTVCLGIPLQSPPPPPRETGRTLKTVELVEMRCCAVAQFGMMYDSMSGLFGHTVIDFAHRAWCAQPIFHNAFGVFFHSAVRDGEN